MNGSTVMSYIIALSTPGSFVSGRASLAEINDDSYKLFFIAVILLETKAGKTISISFLSPIPDLLLVVIMALH